MLGKTTSICLGAAGLAGLGFLSYCIYYDKKRRSDPQYKEKIRERRRQERVETHRGPGAPPQPLPDMADTQAIQSYFLQEIHTGEEKLALGMIDAGVQHLVNAVSVCGQPQQLLQVLQQTLPANIFQQILVQLPSAPVRVSARPTHAEEVDDDLE